MIIKETITFKANTAQVWDLLTNSEMTRQYMYGCDVLSDWKIGSPIVWRGKTEDGAEIDYVKGEILEYEAGKKVRFTMIDPNSDIADTPENYAWMTYELSETEGGTLLTITQGDYSQVADGQKRYEESVKGWEMVIPLMKKLLD